MQDSAKRIPGDCEPISQPHSLSFNLSLCFLVSEEKTRRPLKRGSPRALVRRRAFSTFDGKLSEGFVEQDTHEPKGVLKRTGVFASRKEGPRKQKRVVFLAEKEKALLEYRKGSVQGKPRRICRAWTFYGFFGGIAMENSPLVRYLSLEPGDRSKKGHRSRMYTRYRRRGFNSIHI